MTCTSWSMPTLDGEIRAEPTSEIVAVRVFIAVTFLQRLRGLLGKHGLMAEEALILPATRSIHMFGMRYPIDLVFCDTARRIVAVYPSVKPWRAAGPVWSAHYAIEFSEGTIAKYSLVPGMSLLWNSPKQA